ncbi:phosphoenolpyruvate carboxykinase (ATP) [Halorubellus sp. JP-L1]|uniref:phosphoenolpyruvate carboxykinase (ATP) n=1 Tax=Halorubellus sp. JP-L1 TaxID=2715753 RepID=UPI0014094D26|nr:phosphoenolpyruvate carboxykinase (ATP) [Halorubellus sp. JP-L1]NHN40867.1 phosphoenolpyruvate carboxykinase (ATP) [Halorubellus sp. JP-L1]
MSDIGMERPATSTRRSDFPDPKSTPNVTYAPALDELRSFSTHLETTTEYDSPSYVSEYRSRSADRTRNTVDHEFDEADYGLVADAVDCIGDGEWVCLDRRMGRHEDVAAVCRLFVPKAYGRIALAWAKLFEPVDADEPVEPDYVTVQVPDADETAIRVLAEEGVTAVVGSDYTGEAKKSFLRLFMFDAKRQGGLGLHAGSKRVTVRQSPDDADADDADGEDEGDLATVGQVFLGLSATGKSTLTAHSCWLDEANGESAAMLQDDVCALTRDGEVAGSEGKGLFIKTIGLDRDEQAALYDAATHESAVLENVAVDDDGTVHFDEDRYTTNSRAVVQREHLDSADEDVDLDGVDQVFFITRNPLMPPVAKLDETEAAVAFMLGESIQTSAGDPDAAGEAIRVVGTNPFIMGSEGEEGNRFRDLVSELGVECYVLNTGCVGTGDDAVDVGVEESVTLLREIARDSVDWTRDDRMGLEIPSSVPGIDVSEFYVPDHVDDYERAATELRRERLQYLAQFDALDDDVADGVY